MKRLTALLLVLGICLGLCACGTSSAAKEAQTMIAAIGEDSTDEEVIAAIRAYDALSEEEQASVKNAPELAAARKKLMLKELEALNIAYTLTNLKCDWISETVCDVINNVGAEKYAMYWDAVLSVGNKEVQNITFCYSAEVALYGTYQQKDSKQIGDDCTSIAQAYDSLQRSNALPESVAEFEELFGKDFPDQTELVKQWSLETDLYIQLTVSPSGTVSSYIGQLSECRANLTRYQSHAKSYLPQA